MMLSNIVSTRASDSFRGSSVTRVPSSPSSAFVIVCSLFSCTPAASAMVDESLLFKISGRLADCEPGWGAAYLCISPIYVEVNEFHLGKTQNGRPLDPCENLCLAATSRGT